MKKEELTALGLTDEQAGKILAINGNDIEHAKAVKDKEIGTLTEEPPYRCRNDPAGIRGG